MQFKDAEILLNASMLAGYPPLFVVGDNTIGKTTLLKAMYKKFKKTVEFTTAIDYGGLKEYVKVNKNIKTIVLSDIQSVLSRKKPVQEATFGYISTLIEEGASSEITFSKAGRNADEAKLNVILAGTPRHVVRLIRLGEIDLLTRFLYLPVERDIDSVDLTKPYQLQNKLPNSIKKSDLLKYERLNDFNINIRNIRYKKMINSIILTLYATNYPIEQIKNLIKNIEIFKLPEDTDLNWLQLYNRSMKPVL